MMTGIVEWPCQNLRIPFLTSLKITLDSEGQTQIVYGDLTDLTDGGMKITAPATFQLEPDQKVALRFDLPGISPISVDGVITYRRRLSPSERFQYGMTFSVMTPAIQTAIADYCQNPTQRARPTMERPAVITIENNPTAVAVHWVSAKLQIKSGEIIPAQLEDLSYGGTRIRLNHPLPLNTSVKLILRYGTKTIVLDGIVVFSLREDWEGHGMGIFFNNLSEAQLQNLKHFIRRLLAQMIG